MSWNKYITVIIAIFWVTYVRLFCLLYKVHASWNSKARFPLKHFAAAGEKFRQINLFFYSFASGEIFLQSQSLKMLNFS